MFQFLKNIYKQEMGMKMKSCKNGHYYNEDKEKQCPYCSESNFILDNIGENEEEMTEVINLIKKQKVEETTSDTEEITMMLKSNNSHLSKDFEALSVIELAGWIVIISDIGKGRIFNITYGMNSIGRAKSNQISIDTEDTTISRKKHASIIYDFENNLFFIQHHEGKYLTYLNQKMILDSTKIYAYDKIKIGKTEFIFVPLCGDKFNWEDNNEN